jgi:hypothetical protein
MNLRQGMFRLWVVVSGLWLLGDGLIWYPDFSAERAQISALDKCGKIYPPVAVSPPVTGPWTDYQRAGVPQSGPSLPPGFTLDPLPLGSARLSSTPAITVTQLPPLTPEPPKPITAYDLAGTPSVDDPKLHPDCAPNVGAIALTDFISMHPSERQQARQGSADALRASITSALTYGFAVPVGLMIWGLIMGWVIRGFRSR